MRKALAVLAFATGMLQLVVPSPVGADAPNVVSGHGITVTATRWISARTFEADISTPLISAGAVNGPHRVRITLPNDYFQRPTVRFPVLYLLHGGAGATRPAGRPGAAPPSRSPPTSR